jgi:hypothetical protein
MSFLCLLHQLIKYHQAINIIECREFRNLLLLMREDLKEKDIPHRTKIRESIIKSWESWFRTLKTELSVRLISTKSPTN